MPSEDRDRLFEKALAQHLRRDALAAGDSACLDAETLAAYHERMLSSEEMSLAKDHLVSCARCQETLAQLEATGSVNELQNRDDELVAAAASASGLKRREAVQETGAARREESSKRAGASEFRVRKSSMRRWAVPAGAIAAGLLLWMGIYERRSALSKKSEPATEIAQNRSDAPRTQQFPAAQPESGAKQQKDDSARNEFREALKEQPSAPPPPPVVMHDEMQSRQKAEPSSGHSSADKKARSAAPLASKEKNPKKPSGERNSREEAGRLSAETEPSDVASEVAAPDSVEIAGGKTQNSEAKPQIVEGEVGGAGKAGAPSPPPQAAPSRARVAQSESGAAEIARASSLNKDGKERALYSNAILNAGALAAVAASPDGKSVWRFGGHGAIVYSSDGGKTWESQSAGVPADLTAGSAPSKKICWIAGAAGTLLRTADGGKHWQLVMTPISADLGGVHATDSNHASIWDLPNRLSYETSDGGLSWKQTAGE
jgi:hypothetical protein